MTSAYISGCNHALKVFGLYKEATDATTYARTQAHATELGKKLIPKTTKGRLAALGLLGAGSAALYNSSRGNSSVPPMPVPYLAPQNILEYQPQR